MMLRTAGNSEAASPNTTPFISTISEQVFAPGQTIPPISFSVSDAESEAELLVLKALSTNQAILRDNDIVITGRGTDRLLQISPIPGKRGVTTVLLTAADEGGLVTTNQFVVRIEEFRMVYRLPIAGGAGSGGIADFDGDGNYDIYVRDKFGVFLNRDGAFAKANPPPAFLPFTAMALGDFNGDGHIDVIGSGPLNGGAPGTQLLENRGDGTFIIRTNTGLLDLDFGDRGGIAAGDFDNDGDLDVILSGYTNSLSSGPFVTKLFLNTGEGVFFESGISLPPLVEGFGAAADVNSDGAVDFLLAGATSATYRGLASVFVNQSGTNFARLALSLPPYVRGFARWADFNNDDSLDLLVDGSENSILSGRPGRLYLNDGAGEFTFKTNVFPAYSGTYSGSAVCADYNNDGNLDVLFLPPHESFGTAFLINNNGSGTLTDSVIPLKATDLASFFDFDHDGALDLVIGTGESIEILRNNLHITNTPPIIPRNLASQVLAGAVTLSWDRSTDLEQKGGLSYNLRVGTAPGKNDIMPSMSSANGQLLWPHPGNAWLNTNWTLKLPAGKYYWTVQAIDHGYSASPFAEEQSFQIDQALPKVLTGAATNIASTGATLTALIEDQSSDTLVWFEYGTSAGLGNFTLPRVPRVSTEGSVLIQDPIWQLPPKSNILFRVAASNSVGVVYGITRSFTTLGYTSFTDFNFNTNGLIRSQLFAVDLDGDGEIELAVHGLTREADAKFVLRIFRKTEPELYAFSDIIAAPKNNPALAWCDYDLDGDLDLALTGIGSNGLSIARIFRNDGAFHFTEIDAGLVGLSSLTRRHLAWGDFDNDGRPDLIITGQTADGVDDINLYKNVGADRFVLVPTELPLIHDAEVAWLDYDDDGRLDLFISGVKEGMTNTLTYIFHNERSGFKELPDVLLGGTLSSCDFDNDGFIDALVTGVPGATGILCDNKGVTPFRSVETSVPKSATGGLWADFDNDGNPDFVQSFHSGYFFRNGGNFQMVQDNSFTFSLVISADLMDFDGDGRLDVVFTRLKLAAHFDQYLLGWFRNNSLAVNVPPSPPPNLQAQLDGDEVILTWSGAEDPNQSGGHSYNVRVGSKPGASDVVFPAAQIPTGKLLMNRPGNAGTARLFRVRGLAEGTYYWSVQAIDQSYASSAFSSEASFSIPRIRVLQITSTEVSGGNLIVSATGIAATKAVLQASLDLVTWTESATNEVTRGTSHFTVPAVSPQLFVRVKAP